MGREERAVPRSQVGRVAPEVLAAAKKGKRLEQFDAVTKTARERFAEAQDHYGDAISETGLAGAVIELVGNVARLRQMVLFAAPGSIRAETKNLQDKLVDTLNYAVIGMIMLSELNTYGKEPEALPEERLVKLIRGFLEGEKTLSDLQAEVERHA